MTKQVPEVEKPRKPSLKFQREKDNRMVKGRFIYNELPGGMLAFNFLKNKGDKPIRYTLLDGEIYTVPLAVARHLNKNVAYPEYEFTPGAEMISSSHLDEGKMMRVQRMVRRCTFEPLDFIADEDLQGVDSQIVTVQTV